MTHKIILASGSSARQQLLTNAGVVFDVLVSPVDEAAILASLLAEDTRPLDIVDTLAEYKGMRVSRKHPDHLVISADQILVCNGTIFSKPRDLTEAKIQLGKLRGQGHQLLSAVVIFEDGKPVWRHVGRAQLVMREFSNQFLDAYIKQHNNDLLTTVGCYKLETEGVQLFSRVQGDYFTILGLPLIEVLGFLRTRGVLTE